MAEWGLSQSVGSLDSISSLDLDDETDALGSLEKEEDESPSRLRTPMRYRTVLRAGPDKHMAASGFWISEAYNTGWSGTALVAWDTRDAAYEMSAATMLATIFHWGFGAGQSAVLEMVNHAPDSVAHDMVARAWPCMIAGLRPGEVAEGLLACDVQVVDPISYLAGRTVWGAYADCSAAEIVGGVVSLAAGGDGKPTTSIATANMPRIEIESAYREPLGDIPYALAVGQTFGEWLATFTSMLGLRAELLADSKDTTYVTLRLTDERAKGPSLEMGIVNRAEDTPPERKHGRIAIRGHAAFPPGILRSALLDDPTAGSARQLIRAGPVGEVVTSEGADVDEATLRSFQSLYGSFAEALMLQTASRCTKMRPGMLVDLDHKVHGIGSWQIGSVQHLLRSAVYDNDATLMRSDLPWHPPAASRTPPFMVSAIVDQGYSVEPHQPVPRDRLGRIKVRFPFVPSPVGEEREALVAGDTNEDGRVTLDDFSDEERAGYESAKSAADEKLAKFRAGEFDDPYPGVENDKLTAEQLKERTDKSNERMAAMRYLAYEGAKRRDRQDRDQDGGVTGRDELVSAELEAALRDPERREQLHADATDENAGTNADPLVTEYRKVFLSHAGDSNETDTIIDAASDDAGDDTWPPRIPLPLMEPMAGALHGFIAAHRQGDIARVTVHDPFHAEITGFQYRNDRRINADLSTALGGMVVEHDFNQAWSGIVFRRSEDMDRMEFEEAEVEEVADPETIAAAILATAPTEEETGGGDNDGYAVVDELGDDDDDEVVDELGDDDDDDEVVDELGDDDDDDEVVDKLGDDDDDDEVVDKLGDDDDDDEVVDKLGDDDDDDEFDPGSL